MEYTSEELCKEYNALYFGDKYRYRTTFVLIALEKKDFKFMVVLMENDVYAKIDIIDFSIIFDLTDVLEWLRKREKNEILPRNGFWNEACDTAIVYNKLETLKWLYNNGLELTEYMCVTAAEKNHLDILKYLYQTINCLDKGTDMWRYKVYDAAENIFSEKGDNNMLEYLHSIDFNKKSLEMY